jgi:phytoene synthase
VAEGQLPPLSRLALAYAPRSSREDWLSLLTLDARLAGIVRTAREPMLAQLRLAWWRDRLSSDPSTWPKGEPLLARLAGWGESAQSLSALADGWEGLLGDAPLPADALAEFARGRAGAVRALALRHGADSEAAAQVASRWALADLALHLGDPVEQDTVRDLLMKCAGGQAMPKALRPLAVMAKLNERAVRKGASDALFGPGALLAAIRAGLFGR